MNPSNHSSPITSPAGIKCRRRPSSLLLLAALGCLSLLPCHLAAQDETVPLVQDVRSLQIALKTIGQEVTVKYAVDGNRIFYFPVFLLEEAKLPGGLPFTDASGNLRVPAGEGPVNLTVTLLDLWKSRAYQDDLICTLTNHPVIRSLTPAPQLLPAATTGQRLVTLILVDPNFGNRRLVLAESLLSDLADAQARVSAQFFLDAGDLASLRGASGAVPIKAQHLAVQVEQSYRARYTTTLALINLQSAIESLAFLRHSLVPAPDRGQPTLLLSPNLPQPGTQSGSVVQDKFFTDQVKRFVRLQILIRAGANVDPQLVDRLVDSALTQAPLAIEITDQEKQNAVAAILLDDGLSMSMALSEINQLDTAIHSAQESEYRSALISAATKSQNTEVRGGASASFFGFGGSASAETIQNWSRSDYVDRKMDDIKRQVHDAAVHLSGSVRVMTGIRFSQSGAVQNVSFTSIEQSIGTFTLGDATILNTRSVSEYAALLTTAQQVEALLVPQVLVGTGSVVGSDGWYDLPSEVFIFRDVQITFPKPFASPPSVVTALGIINDRTHSELVFVDAENITSTGFTMHFAAHPASRFHWARASWIASGQARISTSANGGLPSLGTPGLPPLIPAETRQAVLTPQLQSAPQLADGTFRASFNAIPGRSYEVQASTNLLNWASLGATTAEDFNLSLVIDDGLAFPQRFFRVTTP